MDTDTRTAEPSADQADLSPESIERTLDRWRAFIVAGPGDGSTRRRASDVVRAIVAVLVLVLCGFLIRANTGPELSVARFLAPPPDGVRWVVTGTWVVGSIGVLVVLVAGVLRTRNVRLIRDGLAAALCAWLGCVLLGWLFGSTGGRPDHLVPFGISPGYPSVELALASALIVVAVPYLSQGLRRSAQFMGTVFVLAAVVHGAALPLDAVASVVIGYGIAAGVHLIFESPTGLPSVAEVMSALRDVDIDVSEIEPTAEQAWGVARFSGYGPDAGPIEISIYGRDAADAQVLAKLWRFIFYRDSGPTLLLSRLQQVEHEAYLTMRAEIAGVRTPKVLAAGTGGAANDALLVTARPPGSPLRELRGEAVPEEVAGRLFDALGKLRAAHLAHGAISGSTVFVDDSGNVGLSDFRCASSGASLDRCSLDMANALVALALVVGIERATAAAVRHLDSQTLTHVLLRVQPAGLTPSTRDALKGHKGFLDELRHACSDKAEIKLSELAKLQRLRWGSALLLAGTGIGIWSILGVFVNVAGSFNTLRGASWGWVVAVVVLSLLPPLVLAWSLVASIYVDVPLSNAILLQESQAFTGVVGKALASMAITVRFFQRRGSDIAFATTTTVIATAASWIVKAALFAIALPLTWGAFNFHVASQAKYGQLVNLLLYGVVVIGAVAGVALVLPRLRRIAWSRIKPQAAKAIQPIKTLAGEPRRLVALLAGNAVAQLLTALALGAALHAFHQSVGLGTIIVVITVSSMVGGASPVPGGIGVVEAGMIAGLIAVGVPDNVAVSAVFVQRLFTAYLPPIWGWVALLWLRRNELV